MVPATAATRTLSSIATGADSAIAAPIATAAALPGERPATSQTPANEAIAQPSVPAAVLRVESDGACSTILHVRPASVAAGSPTVAHQSAAIAALRDNTTTATKHDKDSHVAPV